MNKVSKKLQKAMKEIEDIARKNDIMGVIALADGEQHGEFGNFIDLPDWSNVKFTHIDDGSSRVDIKVYGKSMPTETNKTVNALVILRDIVGNQYMTLDKLVNMVKEKVDIQEDEGEFIPKTDL